MKKETKKIIREMGTILFVIYLMMLVYFLFFSEEYGRIAEFDMGYRYNLIPFVEVRRFWTYRDQLGFLSVFTNIFGNVIGFVPLGFFLPMLINRMRSGWTIVAAGFIFSLAVETLQLITKVGVFDVDDLILNTLGALMGYLLFMLCNNIRRWIHGKKI